MPMRNSLSLLFIFLFSIHLLNGLFAQSVDLGQGTPQINIVQTNETIMLDGIANESIWQSTVPAKNFTQNFPADSILAKNDTEIHLAYDDKNLYVFIKCYTTSNRLIIPSLRRDYDFLGNDNITILFDTYNDYANALVFGMNPYGVRREATIANSGQSPRDFDESWDNKWDGASKINDDSWTCEMAIPFNTLRFTKNSDSWRFNAYRYDTEYNEISAWIPIPRNRFVMDLGYMGNILWEEPLQKAGRNISVIPYISNASTRDFENDPSGSTSNDFNIGGDAKISVTSGLNLDLTVNPDFSQVEVDQQVTNISRFEIFFPERRQFFLENADLFSGFGATRLNPFFSRRIGVSIDPNTGQNIQNPILYGARLSGKLNDRLRVGLLNMQTSSDEAKGISGFNFSVATADQRISKNSRLAFIGVNKQRVGEDFLSESGRDYNRVFGLEYRLNTPDNKWTGKAALFKSYTPDVTGNDYSHFAQFQYNTRALRVEWAHLMIGNDFISESGFTPRKDFILMSPEAQLNFYPEGKISTINVGFDTRFFLKLSDRSEPFISKGSLEEFNFEPFLSINFDDFSMINVQSEISRITLLNDFDPTRLQEDGIFLPAGSTHSFATASLNYSSDPRKVLTYGIGVTGGSFFNGNLFGFQSSLAYRYQPLGFVSIEASYQRLSLEEPFVPVNLWLIGPRIDFTFTKSVFLTTFIQYNNQLDNLNINTRFQWRFAPVSDFFLVYTDNYLSASGMPFESRNRTLVAKMTYWLNL